MESKTIKVWDEFSSILRNYILGKVKDKSLSEDLLQEVFIKIHLNIDKIQKKQSIKSWVFTIAKNTIIDFFKSESKRFSNLAEFAKEIDDVEEEHTAKTCALPLIKNLPSKYKEAMILSEIEGLRQVEVAKKLNISLSGAKSRIQRGRDLLKQGFIDCCDYKINENGHLVGEHKDRDDCKVCS